MSIRIYTNKTLVERAIFVVHRKRRRRKGGMRNKVVVIDNADSILTLEQRVEIALDRNNQYIIISHHSDGFCPGRNSLRELIVKNNKGKLVPVMG